MRRMRKGTRVGLVGAATIAATLLAGCTGQGTHASTTPKPSLTDVPVASASPTPGVGETPLATTRGETVLWTYQISVWEQDVWKAQSGCGCKAPGKSTELYPAGTAVWALRIELEPVKQSVPNTTLDAGMDTSTLTVTPSWGPGLPLPVEAAEGKDRLAKETSAGWGLASVKDPSPWPWDTSRTYVTAVYVPHGATTLHLQLHVPPTGTPRDDKWDHLVNLDVPVTEKAYQATAGATDE